MIRAILRAQALSLRKGGRGAGLSLLVGLLWYGLWVIVSSAVFMAASAAGADELARYLPLALAGVFAYWQFVPVITASMGSSLDLRKLLVYPIPHGRLFAIEVLLRLTTAGEMVLVLGGGVAGLLVNQAIGPRAWPRALGAALLFVGFNLLLSSGLRSLLERLLSKRRVREVMLLAMLLLWVLPRLAVATGYRPAWLGSGAQILDAAAWPWGAMARAVLPGHSAAGALALLCAWVAGAAWFGRTQFERNLRYDAVAAQSGTLAGAARTAGLMERFYRLPGLVWRDPLAALVEKELRSLARAPRFRMVFIMGFTFGLLVWLPMTLSHGGGRSHAVAHYFLTIVSLYALVLLGQVSYWNAFGLDRSGARIYFVLPQPISKTLAAKNVACLVYVYMEVAVLSAASTALGLVPGWGALVENAVVVGICAMYMLGLGNLSSVYYPRALRPEQMSRGGASGRFQALVFLLYPVALLPVALAYGARALSGSELLFVLVLAIAAVIGGAVYWAASDSAAHAALARREAFLDELSRGEGPVESD